ncbi:MAG: hypothetical protein J5742_04385 [Alphaproteobacteria bacterium]|nr:hypothetical protein [Alphaproteobacteria bacterium]
MKKYFILGCAIFVTSCAKITQSPNDSVTCNLIYGHSSDWNVISDDLARNIYRHNLMCESLENAERDYSL